MGPGKMKNKQKDRKRERKKRKRKTLYYYRSMIKNYLSQLMKMYFNERGPFEDIIVVCVCLYTIINYLNMS